LNITDQKETIMKCGSLPASPDLLSSSKSDSILAARFEAQACLQPEAPAVTMDGASLTYGGLNARANQVAAYLRELGVGPESLVGIHLDRSFDLIAGILAILKAGGAYLPLDLACPEDRLTFMLEDSRARVVLTESRLAARFEHYSGTVVCLDRETGRIAGHRAENVDSITQAHHLAYVIYTSGSTGTPKGCLVTQENVARLFTATDPWFHFGSQDVWTLFHSSAFDFSVWEIFGALLYGGRLVIVPYMVSRSATAFRELLLRERVTVLNQTPSAFRQLIQADRALPPGSLALRYVIFGGEALEFQSLRPWFERYGDRQPQCVNMYGITETTVHVTYRPVSLGDLEANSGSNIGVPIPDLQVYVVDPEGRRVATGEAGEMLVGGLGVARGYLNRPDLSRERFMANPFDPGTSPRLYRTGDLARFLDNGDLEYLGRIDHQVKIRGFRIELNEIESMLARHPGVKDCAVLARADSGSEPHLVAYLVTGQDTSLGVEDLRAHLARKLPEYMVPSAFVFLAALPLTVNGKLDREALPAPGSQRPRLASEYVAPQSDLEKTLADLWKTALRQDQVSVNDNFFDLGADSLMLTTLHRRLESELKREIPITDLFQFSTIRSLAQHLGQKPDENGPAFAPSLMVCKQAGNGKPPFFFAHGDYIFGGLYCQRIVQRLDADQPFYAIAPHGTFGGDLPFSIEEIAASNVESIRSVQPKGPYYLGGFCNGAVAMYEVAQQLIRAGESVKALVLLDPPDLYLFNLRRKITRIGKLVGLPERQCRFAYQRIAEAIEMQYHYGTLRLLSDFSKRLIVWVLKNLKRPFQTAPTASMPNLNFHYYEVMANYQPQPNLGSKSVWIILRQGESHRSPQQISYWSRFIPDARFEVVLGTHLELKNSIGGIAKIIKAALGTTPMLVANTSP
jgi:amino acid adenylation domain-containing protein